LVLGGFVVVNTTIQYPQFNPGRSNLENKALLKMKPLSCWFDAADGRDFDRVNEAYITL
jgi:hypothetical protein